MPVTLTREKLLELCSERAQASGVIALTVKQFKMLGIGYPPKKGWTWTVYGREVSDDEWRRLKQAGRTRKAQNATQDALLPLPATETPSVTQNVSTPVLCVSRDNVKAELAAARAELSWAVEFRGFAATDAEIATLIAANERVRTLLADYEMLMGKKFSVDDI